MARTEVVFKGIHRESAEGVCPDGELMKLTNMTATQEGLKVLTAPHEAEMVGDKLHDIRWFAKGGVWLALNESGDLGYLSTEDPDPPTQSSAPADQGAESTDQGDTDTAQGAGETEGLSEPTLYFWPIVTGKNVTGYETVGNMICCFTSQGIYYVLYKGEEGYADLGFGLPYPSLYVTDMQQKVFAENATRTYDNTYTF